MNISGHRREAFSCACFSDGGFDFMIPSINYHMNKLLRIAGSIVLYLAVMNLMSCTETEYILPPEIAIQTPADGFAIAYGETLDITAEVKNVPDDATYQWSVNGIKVSTGKTLHFEGTDAGNNSVKLTVTTDRGSATDAVNVLVSREEVATAISVVGSRNTTIEYLDSIVLKGSVFCREDYEVEWIIDNERVSKENYYVFRAMKEGTHTITFKALDINGKYATDDIDITVTVPELDAVITEPSYGFKTLVGYPMTLHGDANRIGDVAYEWIVDGKTVGTEQDYTLPASNIDLVDVTLKVTDPTQTSSRTITVDVHDPLKYGTLLFEKNDIHVVDYAGRVTQKVFSAANPDQQTALDNYENDKIVDFSQNLVINDGKIYTMSYGSFSKDNDGNFTYNARWSVIDMKTLTHQRDFTISTPGNSSYSLCVVFLNNEMYCINKNVTNDESGTALYQVNTTTGELTYLMSLNDKYGYQALLSYNGKLYAFNGHQVYEIDPTNWTITYTADGMDGYLPGMSTQSKWNLIDNKLYLCGGTRSYTVFDLNTGKQTDDDLVRKSGSRVGLTLTYPYNGSLYAVENYFLGRVDLQTNELKYIADMNAEGGILCDSYNTPRTMHISKDGILIVISYSAIGRYSNVYVFDVNNPGGPIAEFFNPGKQINRMADIN